jgi:hypothetical protein
LLGLANEKKYIPACFHEEIGPCNKPAIGEVGFTGE